MTTLYFLGRNRKRGEIINDTMMKRGLIAGQLAYLTTLRLTTALSKARLVPMLRVGMHNFELQLKYVG